jgi:hypothetical protein
VDGKSWIAILSIVDEYSHSRQKKSSLEYGSISSNAEIDLAHFQRFQQQY